VYEDNQKEVRMLIRFIAVVSVISMVTIAVLGPGHDAQAGNFYITFVGVKGVLCGNMVATGLGNVQINPTTLVCEVAPPDAGGTQTGLVACGNPGAKVNASPGIQVAVFNGTFETFAPLNPKNCDKNGKCTQSVPSVPNANQLATLNSACPNPNWVALDFAPCAMTVTGQVVGDCNGTETVLGTVTYSCVMPNCDSSITWNKATQTLTGPNYQCSQISSTGVGHC
jgi:hypothetical protein